MKGKVEFDQQKSYFFLQEIISFTPIFADEIRYCRIYKMFWNQLGNFIDLDPDSSNFVDPGK